MARRRRAGHQNILDSGHSSSSYLITPDELDYDDSKKKYPFLDDANAAAGPSKGQGTTLDRLESFFGIDNTTLQPPSILPTSRPSSRTTTNPGRAASGPPGTRLVLQHSVLATDTLQGLALRYKTDVPTLRRVNGLWPGDSVLSRKILWVPLDKCREMGLQSDAKVGIQAADGGLVTEAQPSSLPFASPSGSIASGSNGLHRGIGSSTTASEVSDRPSSSTRSVSAVSSLSPPVVRRLPAEVLGHFPAAARSETLSTSKGKARADQWNEEVIAARPNRQLGSGPGMSGFEPGESGVEDLLQLARQARLSDSQEDKGAGQLEAYTNGPLSEPPQTLPETPMGEQDEPAQPEQEEWKPNVWKFGEKKQRASEDGGDRKDNPSASPVKTQGSPLRPLKLVDKSIEQWEASSTALRPPPKKSEPPSGYHGWNDAPSLEAYTKGRVAEAYSNGGGTGNKKRAARAHHRFMDDLAAGLPPNSGAASKWARPIGESLPGMGGPPSGSSSSLAHSSLPLGASSTMTTAGAKKSSLRTLFGDALRGRVSLDQALAQGFEEVMNRSEGWGDLPSEEMEHARRLGLIPPKATPAASRLHGDQPRISADEARRSLGHSSGGRAIAVSPYHDDPPVIAPPLQDDSMRRKSQHEMEALDSQHQSIRLLGEPDTSSSFLGPPVGAAAARGSPLIRRSSSRGPDNGQPDGPGKWGW